LRRWPVSATSRAFMTPISGRRFTTWSGPNGALPPVGLMNAVGWIGGSTAPVAIAAASQHYGMSACISANSLIYLLFGFLMVYGVFMHMRGKPQSREPVASLEG
jgi:hypothetical protein